MESNLQDTQQLFHQFSDDVENVLMYKLLLVYHAALKTAFQKIFQEQWKAQKVFLENYGITSFEAVITNGTKETRNVTDYSQSGKGGLKILFKNSRMENLAFIWMRGSGTEPVFRIMCDVKGDNPEMEKALLSWETEMIQKADEMCCSE